MLVQSYISGGNNARSEVHKKASGDWEVRHFKNDQHLSTKTFSASADAHDHAKKIQEEAAINATGPGVAGTNGDPPGPAAKLMKILRRRRPNL